MEIGPPVPQKKTFEGFLPYMDMEAILVMWPASYKNTKMSSFKSSENIQKKEGGPDRSASDNQSSSVTLNELAMKARKDTVISSFSKEVIH